MHLWPSLTMTMCGNSFDAAVLEHLGDMFRGFVICFAFGKSVGCFVEGDCDREGDERGDQGEDEGLHVVGFLGFLVGGVLACLV